MSEMTLPFLPMVFAGAYRIFKTDDFSGWVLIVAGCAGCWLAHSPIGLWASLAAVLIVILRWAFRRGLSRREALRACYSALLFAALCGYVFVSLSELTPPNVGHIPRALVIQNVSNTYPAVVKPLTRYASEVTDLQLGYSLLAVLAAGIAIALISRKPALVSLATAGLLLACLVFPVPGINRWLWTAVPQAFIDITNAAPTQRLYAVLAACTVTLAAACLAAYPQGHRRYAVVLAMALLWSGLELTPFFLRGSVIRNSKASSEEALRAENLPLSRFSLGMLTYDNRFFSNGVVDYGMEQRVLWSQPTCPESTSSRMWGRLRQAATLAKKAPANLSQTFWSRTPKAGRTAIGQSASTKTNLTLDAGSALPLGDGIHSAQLGRGYRT